MYIFSIRNYFKNQQIFYYNKDEICATFKYNSWNSVNYYFILEWTARITIAELISRLLFIYKFYIMFE